MVMRGDTGSQVGGVSEDSGAVAQPAADGRHTVLGGIGWSVMDYVGGRALSFAVTVYIARILGAAAFGVYSVFVSVAQTTSVVSEFGTTSYGTREVAQRFPHHAGTVKEVSYVRVMMALAAAVVGGTVLWVIPILHKYRFLTGAALLYVIAFAFTQDWLYGGLRRFAPIALANLTKAIIFGGICVFLVHGAENVRTAMVAYAAMPFVSAGILIWLTARREGLFPFGACEWRRVVQTWREAVPFAGISAGTTLYGTVSLYVLAWRGTMTQVGTFSAAQRPILIAASAVLPIATAFYPFICERYEDGGRFRAYQAAFQRLVLAVSTPIAVVAVVNGDFLMNLLYGAQYGEGHWPFRILALVIPLSAIRLTFTQPLLAAHRQWALTKIPLMTTVVVGLLVLVLFSRFGIVGAAWGVVGGEVVFVAWTAWQAYPLLGRVVAAADLRGILIATAAMFVSGAIPVSEILRPLISLVTYGIVLLTVDDLARYGVKRSVLWARGALGIHNTNDDTRS